ncbi:ThiF family adenylyltransferase [Sphingobium limneticum]|uniref:ThiF family adenylyltransferase n=1 Tax=Sphingobium limneticum TaxID=1007511 RepID=UPI003CFD773E
MWFIEDSGRLGAEQAGLTALERKVDWLLIEGIRLDAGKLIIDLEITASGRSFPASLRYPSTFPHSPPSVLPRDPARWSGHQYGNGELCLEWGPDTWLPVVTGADLVRSAYKLLQSEAPSEEGLITAAPSRHATTMGQDLRYKPFRFLLTLALARRLGQEEGGYLAPMSFLLRTVTAAHITIPMTIADGTPAAWRDPTVSADVERSSIKVEGYVAVLPAGADLPGARVTRAFLSEMRDAGCPFSEDHRPGMLEFLVVLAAGRVRCFWLRDGDDSIWEFTPVIEGEGGRSDPDRDDIAGKRIGIVGCGSAGSKIAISLARSGARDFVLIDDDVLLPENLVRNELDWDGIASHKVDALSRRLEAVAPGCRSTVRRYRLGGQEANGTVDGALSLLGDCDLVIDATADARVFNILSGMVSDKARPLVWLEIFGGGIGGLVARSRPALDPSPQTARARIDAWCADRDVAAPRPAARYEIDGTDGPMIADDADVAVIAAHAVRFALDILTAPAASAFPVSAYFIGLKPGWLFEQPFHCFPINLGPTELRESAAVDRATLALVAALLKDSDDYTAAA